MTGHLLGAAGAVEVVATVLAHRDGVIPPTINLDTTRPGVRPRLRARSGALGKVDVAASNSFGFGGHNVALVFSRFDG